MELYVVNRNGSDRVAARTADGYIDLQEAYRSALLASDECADERAAGRLAATLIPGDTVQLIGMGRSGREACERALAYGKEHRGPWRVAADGVRVEAPIKAPQKLICIGLNYREHALETNSPIPAEPIFFNKFASSITGPYDPVEYDQSVTQELDYEVELGVVIGRRARRVAAEEALQYVFGYTVVNDISARDLQRRDQWVKGKALDTYAPLGPCIVTADDVPDVGRLQLSLRVNGETRQQSDTSELIFSVDQLIAFLSRLMTLEPGDIISTGTPSGVAVGMKPRRYLQPGDVVEAEIEGIGMLRNEIRAV